MNRHKRILALDPAQSCGYAHTNGVRGVWLLGTGNERLVRFRRQLLKAHDEWGFDLIACEDASFGSINPVTAAYHNENLGIIKHVCAELHIEHVSYKPATIKKFATGSGKAKKPQMMRACETLLGIKPSGDDEADALWILEMAKCGYEAPAAAVKRMGRRVSPVKKLF